MIKTKLRPIVKIHGGKYYLSDWIISHFPNNYTKLHYCEPFFGGGSVFLNKEPSKTEFISDKDYELCCIPWVLQRNPKEFIKKLKRKKYTEGTFNHALKRDKFKDSFDIALNEYVLRRMSRGGLKTAFAWSDRLRGGKPGDVNAWESAIDQLQPISDRLKNTDICCCDYKVALANNTKGLIYLDPPYLPKTRTVEDVYDCEMNLDDHIELLDILDASKAKIIVSGYRSELYDHRLKEWNRVEKNIVNHSSQSKSKDRRVECLWMNY